jgi:sodium-dependent dicarboxylate transporter 2/3/5
MIYALPISVAMFALTWFLLKLLFGPGKAEWASLDKRVFRQQYQKLGPMLFEEKIILVDFCLMALLWMTRSDLEIGDFIIPGWAGLFNFPEYINDGTVAIFLAVILFFIPSKNEVKSHIMKWETASKLPWHIVLLFGGGFALATGFKESGLSTWFGEQMSFLSGMHPILIILMVSLMVTFLTELTSNTATVEMILPILAGLAVSLEINPLYLMLPAAISGSMAFMLPVATPPNTIIFGTNRVSVAAMARTGIYLNLAGAIVITLITYLLAGAVFGADGAALPAWATQP